MEQELDIKQQLTVWLANPEKVSKENAPVLKDLALLYPYFQPLHLLLAKAMVQTAEQQDTLATAALYTNGQLLHNVLHSTDELVQTKFNVIHSANNQSLNQPDPIDIISIDEVPAELGTPHSEADEQEVFEEISEVNVRDYNPTHQDDKPKDELIMESVVENIVSSDFFAFQENFDVEEANPVVAETEHNDVASEPTKKEDPVVISKYDDDQLPYTFLWWLAKTRAEHQQIFQPYASPKKTAAEEQNKASSGRPRELQQQYVEHIFHMQSPFDAGEEGQYTTESFRNPKGAAIIESFIKNDPQISPPKPEQIDNENKAKKSAEDHNDLVSETLAKIYIEQMLYDKAIETYEKLSLKFPEKSRYFADLIQSIEKKI